MSLACLLGPDLSALIVVLMAGTLNSARVEGKGGGTGATRPPEASLVPGSASS